MIVVPIGSYFVTVDTVFKGTMDDWKEAVRVNGC